MRTGRSNLPRWFRNFQRVFAVVFVILVVYLGWTFYWRVHENRVREDRASEAQRAKQRDEAARTVATLGGSEFAILNFYASPPDIRRGESTTLCYGVSNAKSVEIEPPVEEVWPSVSRCFDVSPKKTTTYQLTARDASGHTQTASLEIRVH